MLYGNGMDGIDGMVGMVGTGTKDGKTVGMGTSKVAHSIIQSGQ
jgi:hypothetical protein